MGFMMFSIMLLRTKREVRSEKIKSLNAFTLVASRFDLNCKKKIDETI